MEFIQQNGIFDLWLQKYYKSDRIDDMNNVATVIKAIILTFKLILITDNNWESYKRHDRYEVREVEIREVEKMLACMDYKNGYSLYMCEDCGSVKKIAHSCKSRICSRCGKKHADEWAEKINAEMYAVPYRHIILTVSDKLWKYFEGNAKMQKLMLDTAGDVMKEIVQKFNPKRKKAQPGIIMVLHPFGRDLKTNMHVHMLMTEGGLTSNGEWIEMPYIDYRIIRKKWQYGILKAMKKALPQDRELGRIIDWCFKERTNGFNIQAKRRIEGKTKSAARYMARYVRHPAIADSRIVGYDGKNVTFVYDREQVTHTVVMDKYEFIHNVIKHIPNKNFKMVRYYGIHGRRARKNVREVMEKLGKLVKYVIKPFSWRENIISYKGKDPLKCDQCGGQMLLYKIVHRNKNGEIKEYGNIDRLLRKIMARRKYINEKEEKSEKETHINEIKEAVYSQVCLF